MNTTKIDNLTKEQLEAIARAIVTGNVYVGIVDNVYWRLDYIKSRLTNERKPDKKESNRKVKTR